MESSKEKRVLISGASFAGLSTAYWMQQLGYQVTVVEIAPELKKGGTPVNIMGNTIDIVQRMGLFDQLLANQIKMEVMEFKNADDVTERTDFPQKDREERGEEEYEIERDVLLHLLFEAVQANATFMFGDSITAMAEAGTDGIDVVFKSGQQRTYDLVFGCDGIHSVVRKHWFGEESAFSHFLKTYFSITIVPQLLIPANTIQMYNEPGKMIMLNAYHGKTDIVLCFSAEQEIPYDYRNEAQQRQIILDQFQAVGWRTPELLAAVQQSPTFYFDKLCQMKMPAWTKGRVALAGDAGYCPSPAAGRGGSIAIDGAAALGDAFRQYPDNFALAFQEYERRFRPFIEEVQAEVVDFGLDMLLPRTEEAIRERNMGGGGF